MVAYRQLAYDGAEFELKMIDLAKVFQVQYGRAAAMWQLLDMLVGKRGCWDAAAKRIMTGFWGDHLRFFKSMLMASKVEALAEEARTAVQNDFSVVIGLQSTGEANLQAEKAKQGMLDASWSASCWYAVIVGCYQASALVIRSCTYTPYQPALIDEMKSIQSQQTNCLTFW